METRTPSPLAGRETPPPPRTSRQGGLDQPGARGGVLAFEGDEATPPSGRSGPGKAPCARALEPWP